MIGASLVAAGVATGAAVVAHGAFHPRSRLFGPVISRAPSADRLVGLSFDDGPTPGLTDDVLDVLAEFDAKATFFVIGRLAARHPELVHRIHDAGHLIGNHTRDHHRHGLCHRNAYWRQQVRGCGDIVADIIGARPRLFRPPMGFTSPHIMHGARYERCQTITWSRRGLDTMARPRESIARRVLDGLEAGEIVALHDGIDGDHRRPNAQTPRALEIILTEMRRQDLRPARLDDLLELEGLGAG